ncbi:MAG: hypothetical protein ACRCTY_05665 [Candidatus Adiutrix sp.]
MNKCSIYMFFLVLSAKCLPLDGSCSPRVIPVDKLFKKLLLIGVFFFTLGASQGRATDGNTSSDLAILNAPAPFNLTTDPEDAPNLKVMKAALRLVATHTVTVKQLKGCVAAKAPEAEKISAGYNSRNGNTFAKIMSTIKRLGGMTQGMKMAVDRFTHEASANAINCATFLPLVQKGEYDLYKGAVCIDDYRVIMSFK